MKGGVHIYDYLTAHRRVLWVGLSILSLLLVTAAALLRYDEDIMDFLPATEEEKLAFEQTQSRAASRLVLVIEGEPELREQALDECAERIPDLQTEIDLEELVSNREWLISNISDSIYDRFDSLFTPQAIHQALERDQMILSTPGTSFLLPVIRHDPLDLAQLSRQSSTLGARKSYAFYASPYGGTETRRNAALADSLAAVTDSIMAHYPSLRVHWTGAPVIAVANARRIKIDTVLCVALALVLIMALLLYAFPRKRDIWLILLSVSFGWLVGMAVLRLVTPTVSVIVLGIGSVLIGIAVNYPLHLLVHQRYTTSVRQTLQEVLSPLVIGNITTVGAFLTLVPMRAMALRDLGIFAASMLVGTIVFCVFVLPHLMSAEPTPVREIKIKNRPIGSVHSKYISWSVLAITLVLGVYLTIAAKGHIANSQWFDANMSHINYMTPQQREDMAALDLKRGDATRWTNYWQTHDPQVVIDRMKKEAESLGYTAEAFQPFYDQLAMPNVSGTPDSGKSHAESLAANGGLINDLAQRLSDDFDYIGLCCSLIVFLFLWLSFRSVVLALIAFVPMVLSWVWILAAMQMFGLQFNIVNVILATFIFGQGDDYTIFVVEGLLYEHRTGKPMVAQYTQSIILSALIMLVGIGVLIFAAHPALHSLGAVTLIGMAAVVVMALTVPPVLFRLCKRFIR